MTMLFHNFRTRRSVLRQGAVSLALPMLTSFADTSEPVKKIKRMVFLGGGYGFTSIGRDLSSKYNFYPTKAGKFSDIGLTRALMPLKRHQDDLTMVSNLTNLGAHNPHGGSGGYLNCGSYRTHEASISCDQIAGWQLGKDNRFLSLVMTAREKIPGQGVGHGAGYSLSYDSAGKSIPGIGSPLQLYKTMFAQKGDTPEKIIERLNKRKSILDLVKTNGAKMRRRLATEDKVKLEEYFDSIRDIELDLKREGAWAYVSKMKAPFEAPSEGMDGIKEVKLMLDMLILALQTDMTRVGSYRLPVEAVIKSININSTPHQLSHYGSSETKTAESHQRDKTLMEIYSWFLDRLKETKDQDGERLFDSCIVNYGTNLRAGHGTQNIPTLLSGRGAKDIVRGRHIILPKENTNLANYWLTLLQQAGVKIDRFHYSDGVVPEILSLNS